MKENKNKEKTKLPFNLPSKSVRNINSKYIGGNSVPNRTSKNTWFVPPIINFKKILLEGDKIIIKIKKNIFIFSIFSFFPSPPNWSKLWMQTFYLFFRLYLMRSPFGWTRPNDTRLAATDTHCFTLHKNWKNSYFLVMNYNTSFWSGFYCSNKSAENPNTKKCWR